MATEIQSGSSILRPRARLIKTIGEELISSDVVAVMELVKNSYDADASIIVINFKGEVDEVQIDKKHTRKFLKRQGASIIISDDGKGMSLQTIKDAWMEPATIMKKKEKVSPGKSRRYTGEKGIGRFASAKLSSGLEIVTREIGDNEVVVNFNWNDFTDDSLYLDEVSTSWEVRKPIEISKHGTQLTLTNLNADWVHCFTAVCALACRFKHLDTGRSLPHSLGLRSVPLSQHCGALACRFKHLDTGVYLATHDVKYQRPIPGHTEVRWDVPLRGGACWGKYQRPIPGHTEVRCGVWLIEAVVSPHGRGRSTFFGGWVRLRGASCDRVRRPARSLLPLAACRCLGPRARTPTWCGVPRRGSFSQSARTPRCCAAAKTYEQGPEDVGLAMRPAA